MTPTLPPKPNLPGRELRCLSTLQIQGRERKHLSTCILACVCGVVLCMWPLKSTRSLWKSSRPMYIRIEALSCSICPIRWSFNVRKVKNVALLVQDKEHVHKMCSFNQGSLPLSVYTGVIHVIKWTRPSPSVFAYCKNWTLGRPWNKTTMMQYSNKLLHDVMEEGFVF